MNQDRSMSALLCSLAVDPFADGSGSGCVTAGTGLGVSIACGFASVGATCIGVEIGAFEVRQKTSGGMAVGSGLRLDQLLPQRRTQMGRIDAAENAVPVGVIALRAEKMRARLSQLFRCASSLRPCGNASKFG